jgi:hypothetical protein
VIEVNKVKILDKPIRAEIRAISEKEDGRKHLIIYMDNASREKSWCSRSVESLYLALQLSEEAEEMIGQLVRNNREEETACLMGMAQAVRKIEAKRVRPQEQEKVCESKEST